MIAFDPAARGLAVRAAQSCTTRAELKAMPARPGMRALLSETRREGEFVFRRGDYSAKIESDPREGVFIRSDTVDPAQGAWVRIYGESLNILWFLQPGESDETAALEAALAQGPSVFLPTDWIYSFNSANIPAGSRVFSHSPRFYAYSQVQPERSAIVCPSAGATDMFALEDGCTFEGLVLVGDDATLGTFRSATGERTNRHRFHGLSIFGFATGIGGPSSQYFGVSEISHCTIAGNNIGVSHLIDSKIVSSFINSNATMGLYLNGGANDNVVDASCKIEWNGTYNILAYQSVHNVVSGAVIDAGGYANVKLSGTAGNPAELQIVGANLRRGSRNTTSGDNAHIVVGSYASLYCTNIVTKSGAEDSGSGPTTPAYFLKLSGNPDKVVLSDIDATGATGDASGSIMSAGTYWPKVYKVANCIGLQSVNNAQQYGVIAPAGTKAKTITLPPIPTYSSRKYRVSVIATDTAGALARVVSGSVLMHVYRGGGAATAGFAGAAFELSATGAIGAAASDVLQLSVGTVATDGSTIVITLANNHASYSYNPMLEIRDV